MRNSLSTDWLILRPLLVVAIVWATIVAGLVADWIRRLMTARGHRASSDPTLRKLAMARTEFARREIDSGSPPSCTPANDCESRAA